MKIGTASRGREKGGREVGRGLRHLVWEQRLSLRSDDVIALNIIKC